MKRDPYKNLRYCEKIKEKECFIEADGLQKKVRKFDAMRVQEGDKSIDADVKMRQIQCFWKEGWEYNHTHHIYLEPKVTRPIFYIKHENSKETHKNLQAFYAGLRQYVSRMKVDNQDETNYKIEVVEFKLKDDQNKGQRSQMQEQISQLIASTQPITEKQIANMSLKHLLSLFYEVSTALIYNFQQSQKKSAQSMTDEFDPFQIEDIKNIHDQLIKWVKKNNEYHELFQEANRFQLLFMNTIKQSKNSKIFSAAICEQPLLCNMTQMIHPLLIGLYSLFSEEMLVKAAKKKRGKRYADQYEDKLKLDGLLLQQQFKPIGSEPESMNEGGFLKLLTIKDNLRAEQERHSKVLFVNLDGYQSEFNLQFVRNYHENIMYVSFPMFQKGEQNDNYNKRFNKKIMYNLTRQDMNILGMEIDDPVEDIYLKEQLLFNPQKYHQTIDHIYHLQNHVSIDRNKNLYVFPINLPNMKSDSETKVDISQREKNISGYESQYVKFIMRDQLYNAMRNYKPSIILLSYSGKLNLTNEHFLEIMQELIKIQPKIIFFPNLTSAFHDRAYKNSFTRITQSIGKGILHSKEFLMQNQIKALQMIQLLDYNPWEIDFFDKMAIFLKVSAGYYNLNRPFQQEGLQQKYKSSRVFKYVSYIYGILKNQYQHCQRRLESNSLQVARANLQNTIRQHSKEISKSVPEYYKRLFLNIRVLLQEGNTADPEHRLLVEEVRDYYPFTHEQDEPYLSKWQQMQKAEELQLASAKYDEIAPIQLREKQSRAQYQQNTQNNKQSFIWLSFCYRDQNNQIVRIYKQTSILYKENQINESSFNVVIYNIFNATETQFMHCYAKPIISRRSRFLRCKIAPIAFISKQGLINPNSNFKIWTDWSYTETNSHIVMYWPSQFDFISFYLHKLIGRKYEPKVMKCFYAAKKSNESTSKNECPFYQINVVNNRDFIPRWGSSAINADDQLYFFGGAYSGEKSYLNLQNDISTLDLSGNNLEDFPQTKLFNIRKQLYSGEAFQGKLREKREVNSFVRPRADFQFYDQNELLIDQNALLDEDIRVVYAIGGFGEDFKTPYSLFVNYYYELKIQKSTKRLVSINKRNIPNKIIPVNIKSMIKNRGIYQKANILATGEGKDMESAECSEGMTSNLHYFHHRVAYAIQKQELNYRVKSLIAVQLYRNCKRDFIILSRRLGQARQNRDSEQQAVEIRKVEGNNHQILVEQGEQYYLYSLQLQVGNDFEEIPLMNESIISIDSKKKMVCALIRHSQHTSNNCILASQTVKPINQTNEIVPHHEKHYSITLKKIASFNENLNMHILLICNANEFAILHGLSFKESKVKDYLIKIKKNKDGNNEVIKQQIPKEEVNPQMFSNITSFFLKKNNKITSINILQHADHTQESHDYLYTLVLSTLDVARHSEGWRSIVNIPRFAFMSGKTVLKRLTFEARADNSSDPGNIILIMSSSKRTYHLRLNKLLEGAQFVNVPELLEKNDIELYKSIDCLPKILKNEELYEDMNYFQ